MAVYHYTYHGYRTWRPDHPRGYTQKGKGYQPPDPERAEEYDERATQDAVIFDARTQRQILVFAHEICEQEGWKLEAAGFDDTHAHLVVSWARFIPWEEVDRRLKNLLALKLNRLNATPGKRWFARRHGAPRRVRDRAHLAHLLKKYFPDHRGIFWKRGLPLPKL